MLNEVLGTPRRPCTEHPTRLACVLPKPKVDFASKRQERDGGWALRNAKLRLSRKLIYVAGLWMCLSCSLRPSDRLQATPKDDPDFLPNLTEHLLAFVTCTPLEILAKAFLAYGPPACASKAFRAYDRYLAILDDPKKRKDLEQLDVDSVTNNRTFDEARTAGRQFQEALAELFFATDPDLTRTVQHYGVF